MIPTQLPYVITFTKRIAVTINSNLAISKAHYATASQEPIDHHKRFQLHEWPKSAKPSAYEIFGLTSKDMGMSTLELNKVLKRKYLALVKIYHPDTSLSIQYKGGEMTAEMKRKRFDMIQEAYDILKNLDVERHIIGIKPLHGINRGIIREMEDNGVKKFEAYRRAHAHRTRYNFENDEQFWLASTWQDYYQMKYNRPPPTKEELEKTNTKSYLGLLLLVY